MQTLYLRVPNLERHQHYKHRRPPWIKLHAQTLDDYEFSRLQDASKAHLMLLWLLASQSDNLIPFDAEWIAKRINASGPLDIDGLLSAGFIIVCDSEGRPCEQDASAALASRKQNVTTEKSRDRDRDREESLDAGASDERPDEQPAEPAGFADAWAAYPERGGGNPRKAAMRAYGARINAGRAPAELLAGTERYARYIRARNREHTEFVMQAKTFFGPDDWWAEPWSLPASVPGSADWEADQLAAQLEAERDSTLAPLPPGPLQ